MKTFVMLLALVGLMLPVFADETKSTNESVRGHVLSVKDGGVLVECHSQDYINNNDQTAGIDLKDVDGVIFLYGHPSQKEMIDRQHIGVIAVRAGTYHYETVLGAQSTVAAYKFVQNASSR